MGRGNPEVNKTPIESLLNKLRRAFGASHPHIVKFTFRGVGLFQDTKGASRFKSTFSFYGTSKKRFHATTVLLSLCVSGNL